MKTCKTGCGGKMKAGGSVKKVKKMATGGQALNKAKGFAPAQKGGDNVSKQIYGIPNAGPTGPNLQGIDTMKKGGSIKKYQDGGMTLKDLEKQDKKILATRSGKIGVGASVAGMLGIAGKAIADKIKAKRTEKKAEEEKKKKETAKAKFGASVNVQRGYPGKIRSAGDQGYTAVGKREPARTKFQDGGKITVINASPNDPYPKEQRRLKAELEKAKKVKAAGIKLAKAKRLAEEKANAKTKASYKEGAKKYQKGGFPDLTGDGKVTKADVLKGRGVIKKKGGSIKK
jgi:hypothetical protein